MDITCATLRPSAQDFFSSNDSGTQWGLMSSSTRTYLFSTAAALRDVALEQWLSAFRQLSFSVVVGESDAVGGFRQYEITYDTSKHEIIMIDFPKLSEIEDILSASGSFLILDIAPRDAIPALLEKGASSIQDAVRALSYRKAIAKKIVANADRTKGTHQVIEGCAVDGWSAAFEVIVTEALPRRAFESEATKALRARLQLLNTPLDVDHQRDLEDTIRGPWGVNTPCELFLGKDLFVYGDSPLISLNGPVDLTGPARILVGGPYLFVPPGWIRCEMDIFFDHRAQNEPFLLNVYAATDAVATFPFIAPRGGVATVKFNFMHPNLEAPLDIHLVNATGAIEGSVDLLQARLSFD